MESIAEIRNNNTLRHKKKLEKLAFVSISSVDGRSHHTRMGEKCQLCMEAMVKRNSVRRAPTIQTHLVINLILLTTNSEKRTSFYSSNNAVRES